MIVIAQKPSKLLLLTTASVIVNSIVIQKIHAQAVDLNNLCQKHRLSSDCAGYTSPLQTKNDSKLAANKTRKTIKMRLKTLLLIMNGCGLRSMETPSNPYIQYVPTGTLPELSTALWGLFSPVPLPNVRFDKWLDAPTTRVVFQADNCSISPPPQVPQNSSPQENQQISSPPQPDKIQLRQLINHHSLNLHKI
jgi:hypothetical protein